MRNSSTENGDRPTLPSIWDLFREELSEPASRYNFQAPSPSDHPEYVSSRASLLPSGQDRRYDEWVSNHPACQNHPSALTSSDCHGPSLSPAENPAFIQHQVPDVAGPTHYQASIPQPQYYTPQEVHQTHGYHNPGTSPIPSYQTSASTSSTDSLSRQGSLSQTTHLPTPSDMQGFDETNPGANYHTFRCTQLESHDESGTGKYECQYCGKTFSRPSTLRIHLNSHTGEKPFVCPVEDCGRGFSVLSNMRRHARVHAQPTTREGTAQLPGGDTSSRGHQ